jgi:hypothetical protein
MDRAERWRIVLEKLKIAVPKDYQYYIQFKNNLLIDSNLDANIPWLNVVNLFTSNGSWSHLLFLKYFSNINPKPDLKIKDILIDILKDTNISTYRNYSCAKLISIVGTTEELKISNIIKNLIEKDTQKLVKSESIYQESINKNVFVTDEKSDSAKISFVSLFLNFSQIYKNKLIHQKVNMIDILNIGTKIKQFYDGFKEQYDKHNLIIKNWKEILAKIKYRQYDKQIAIKNWKEILVKTKDHKSIKSIIHNELILEDIILKAFNIMEIYELRKYNNINVNNNDNKMIKSKNNLCKNGNIWEIIDIKYNIKKFLKIIMKYNLFQMVYMENQLVLVILNKYLLIQEYINNMKFKNYHYYGKKVQEKFKWLVKNGQIKIVEQLMQIKYGLI